ncbi:hypothetical protein [Vreelandella alkaliphila]|uniref:Uncharacterized protein n=1 Tax=Vreelandella alkaliphila TaxID=272774 RepID=A0ABX4HLC5_9GAMM|nr:hypothetical protein [Halomonas humidisoli]PAU73297.1 hypothetical protein CK497_01460 [Halomonas humidisoli]
MTTTADQLTPKQNALASRVFVETMSELAKHRINHGKLEAIADELSSALRIGLSEINAVNPLTTEQVAKLERMLAESTPPPSSVSPLGERRIHSKEELALLEATRAKASNPICVLSATSSASPPGLSAAEAAYCQMAELRRKRKHEMALLESQALKARGKASCASCRDQGENGDPIHPQAMSCDSRGEQP